jgi:hypothetical protein
VLGQVLFTPPESDAALSKAVNWRKALKACAAAMLMLGEYNDRRLPATGRAGTGRGERHDLATLRQDYPGSTARYTATSSRSLQCVSIHLLRADYHGWDHIRACKGSCLAVEEQRVRLAYTGWTLSQRWTRPARTLLHRAKLSCVLSW